MPPRDEPILLTPGPVTTSPGVQRALASANFSHREPRFGQLLAQVGASLVRVAGAPHHDPILLAGSGTAATEAAFRTLIGANETLLVASNGAFGERLVEVARTVGLSVRHLQYGWGEPMVPDDVQRAAAGDRTIAAVAIVQHETSVGSLNPVHEIGQALQTTRARLFVDVVSSLGAESFDADASNVAVVIGTANKCLHGVPGVSFVLVRPDAWAPDADPRSVYLDLRRYRSRGSDGARIPFTPAVHALAALDEALHELDEEGGVAVRQLHYRALNDRLRAGLDARGLRTCFNAPPRSCSLTVAEVPAGQTSDELYHSLLRRGFIVYQAKGDLRERCFLIANMGHLQIDTIDRFLDAVADCVTVGIHST